MDFRRLKMERIVNKISSMSGQYHPHNIFQDWVQMMAISISNQVIYNQHLEDQYISIAKKYSNDELIELSKLEAVLVELFENKIHDYLGEIYMKLDAGSKRTGQFFTPFHICELMAQISLVNYKGDIVTLNEPSVGGGGNVLAYAKIMLDKGINYQEKLKVIAQDLDYKCVFMSYVQFSISGINACVIQGDTLMGDCNLKLYTPMYLIKGGGLN